MITNHSDELPNPNKENRSFSAFQNWIANLFNRRHTHTHIHIPTRHRSILQFVPGVKHNLKFEIDRMKWKKKKIKKTKLFHSIVICLVFVVFLFRKCFFFSYVYSHKFDNRQTNNVFCNMFWKQLFGEAIFCCCCCHFAPFAHGEQTHVFFLSQTDIFIYWSSCCCVFSVHPLYIHPSPLLPPFNVDLCFAEKIQWKREKERKLTTTE